jgi:hypothetical protein
MKQRLLPYRKWANRRIGQHRRDHERRPADGRGRARLKVRLQRLLFSPSLVAIAHPSVLIARHCRVRPCVDQVLLRKTRSARARLIVELGAVETARLTSSSGLRPVTAARRTTNCRRRGRLPSRSQSLRGAMGPLAIALGAVTMVSTLAGGWVAIGVSRPRNARPPCWRASPAVCSSILWAAGQERPGERVLTLARASLFPNATSCPGDRDRGAWLCASWPPFSLPPAGRSPRGPVRGRDGAAVARTLQRGRAVA